MTVRLLVLIRWVYNGQQQQSSEIQTRSVRVLLQKKNNNVTVDKGSINILHRLGFQRKGRKERPMQRELRLLPPRLRPRPPPPPLSHCLPRAVPAWQPPPPPPGTRHSRLRFCPRPRPPPSRAWCQRRTTSRSAESALGRPRTRRPLPLPPPRQQPLLPSVKAMMYVSMRRQ